MTLCPQAALVGKPSRYAIVVRIGFAVGGIAIVPVAVITRSSAGARHLMKLKGRAEVGVEGSDYGEQTAQVLQRERGNIEVIRLLDARRMQRVHGEGCQEGDMACGRDGHRLAAC